MEVIPSFVISSGAVNMETGCRLEDREVIVRVMIGGRTLLYRVHTDSGSHPVSYPVDWREGEGVFPLRKAA
jgi:hypothetical protein